jgi:hypothetical protein
MQGSGPPLLLGAFAWRGAAVLLCPARRPIRLTVRTQPSQG